MITRISKIARLPLKLREQLNHRLQNGDLGQPINKQNLSEWRHGGYQDWLRHQARQQTIQRIAEQGDQFSHTVGSRDLCESFSQIVIAELLEHLHEITDRNQRWQRLRELSRELARLQHGFNHSRSVELAWTKRNDQFQDTDDTITPPTPPAAPAPDIVDRAMYHRRCGRGCVCPDCHPEDGPYPYSQAVQDAKIHAEHYSPCWIRGNVRIWVTHIKNPSPIPI